MKVSAVLISTQLPFALGTSFAQVQCKDLMETYKHGSCCGRPDELVDHQVIPMPKKQGNKIMGTNRCEGKKPAWIDADTNCTKSSIVDAEAPQGHILDPFWKRAMCPVNVHWHVGAEHKSYGNFDESFNNSGPVGSSISGFRCGHYDPSNATFTTPYNWKYCSEMVVGETYEVQWPHSCLGACGTNHQYQSPYYDGMFCDHDGANMTPQGIADCIGVQAQVFTVVNDETYYYPDLIRGMIVQGAMGKNLGIYDGSMTSSSGNNTCSTISPVTWQVDRECHLISASSFDKMCADMLSQHDDMSLDVRPHSARELVWVYTTTTTTPAVTTTTICTSHILAPGVVFTAGTGQGLRTCDGKYRADFQANGKFVLYRNSDDKVHYTSENTEAATTMEVVSATNQLTLYNAAGKVVYVSGDASYGTKGSSLFIKEGFFAIIDKDWGNTLWATNP